MFNREAAFRMKYRFRHGLSFFLVLSLLAVCSCAKLVKPADKPLLTVGDRIFGEDELKTEIMQAAFEMGIPKDNLKQYLDPLLQRIIDLHLILEYGQSHGIHLTDTEFITSLKEVEDDYPESEFKKMLLQNFIDYDEWKDEFQRRLLIKKIISSALKDFSPVTVDEIKHYFNTHREEFRHGERLKVRQVVTSTRSEAGKVLQKLNQGQNWEELAAQFSIAPEAKEGGVMGWISRGVLEESMEETVFSLAPGRPSSVVKTPYGFHIFEVMERVPAGEDSLPQAMVAIESKLSQARRDKLYQKWLQDLRRKLSVKVNHKLIKQLEFG